MAFGICIFGIAWLGDCPVAAAPVGPPWTCAAVSVWDGDGPIRCADGVKIRIGGIAAREMDGSCRRGHPCPDASAVAARDALVRLLGGSRGIDATGHVLVKASLQCRTVGTSYGRVVAACILPDGRDIGEAMIATGTVLRWNYRR